MWIRCECVYFPPQYHSIREKGVLARHNSLKKYLTDEKRYFSKGTLKSILPGLTAINSKPKHSIVAFFLKDINDLN
ncbi:hypothetical protein BpHYR1_052497 [Brachionus plicatilis]|uniref:Uncharacterized protein n=1 Tax=Brachionus plicatilis TaxID=10195 RepID=A0A3M7R8H4_BRAPC|nr:hypothetical protein BpHYR1_052497 [Brachionus plicatilis]